MWNRASWGGLRHWQGEDDGAVGDRMGVLAMVGGTTGNDFIHEQGDGLTAPPGYNDATGVTESADTIDGSEGDDIIHGAGGSDFIIGGAGTDRLCGGAGNDIFQIFANSDISGLAEIIDGGVDSGTLFFKTTGGSIDLTTAKLSSLFHLSLGSSTETALDLTMTTEQLKGFSLIDSGGPATNHVSISDPGKLISGYLEIDSGIELHGSSGNDRWFITGEFFSTAFDMGVGNDSLRLKSIDHALPDAVHTLSGGDGDDYIRSDFGINILSGDTGDDHLAGGSKADTLDGGGDDDILDGGGKGDMLTGGSGADTFLYGDVKDSRPGNKAHDTITDFSHAEGDRIDLSAIDANSDKAGDQAFHLVAGGAFTGHGGELIQVNDGGGHIIIQCDVNGDSKADFQVLLDQAPVLTGADFVL